MTDNKNRHNHEPDKNAAEFELSIICVVCGKSIELIDGRWEIKNV